jgi:exonuclease III
MIRNYALLIAAALGLLLAACSRSDDVPEEKTGGDTSTTFSGSRLTIMTFNAEFMWDGVEPEQGNVELEWKNDPVKAEARMAKIAEIIRRANPDIVNLVEVENLNALQTLNRKFLASQGYTAYLVEGRDSYTGQDVGLLSRIAPEGGNVRPDFRKGTSGDIDKVVSKNYNARFVIGDTKLALIGLHFLAQPDREDRRFERQAQADAIRRMALDHLHDGYLPVVLGDFNDFDGEENSRDHQGSIPITFVVSSIKAMDPEVPDDDLVNVSSFIPQDERYTAFWDRNNNGRVERPRELTSIDHLLISNKLAGRVERAWMPHDHDPVTVSDHFPVVVTLRLSGNVRRDATVEREGTGEKEGPMVSNLTEADRVAATTPASLSIHSILPDPVTSDEENEEVTIRNNSGQPVKLIGWKLRDKSGRAWTLDKFGTMVPGKETPIRRRGQAMALNNEGDMVELLDPKGTVIDRMTYGKVQEGEVVKR